MADAALGGDEQAAEAARNATYAARAELDRGVARSRALGLRLEQHKRDTLGWLADRAVELDRELRAQARPLADRLAALRAEEADVLGQAEQLRQVWQRVEHGRAAAADRGSGDEITLDPDRLVPRARGDVRDADATDVPAPTSPDNPLVDDFGAVEPFVPSEA
jgi:hypothetical protein